VQGQRTCGAIPPLPNTPSRHGAQLKKHRDNSWVHPIYKVGACFIFTSTLYPQRNRPWYSMDRKLGRPQSWSGSGVEQALDLPGIKPQLSSP